MVNLINISKGFGIQGTASYRLVLDNLSFELSRGDSVAITGPSGSGKTTVLNIIGTLDEPDKGEVIIDGNKIKNFKPDELAEFRNRKLGFVFQMHYLLPQLSLFENVLLPFLPLKKRASASDIAWAEHLIRKVGIWEQRNQKPSEMSGGECQRAALVRALVNKPELLLADEPTGALDRVNALLLSDILVDLSREEGITLMVVTHSGSLAQRLNKTYDLVSGKLIRSR